MLLEAYFLLVFLGIGLLLGLLFLPWWKRSGAGSDFAFLRRFVLLWPFLLLDYMRLGGKAYWHAWKRYLHARNATKLK